MNWFQRYGIPGLYFFGFLSTLYVITYNIPNIETLKYFLIFFISVSVPVGYIITIIAQLLYYIFPCRGVTYESLLRVFNESLPSKYARILKEKYAKIFKEKDKPFKRFYHKECDAEIIGVYYGIIHCTENEIKRGEWLQKWFNKRFDVWAINNSIILATIIGLLIFVIFNFQKTQCVSISFFCSKIFIPLICSFLIIFFLCFLNHILKRQIKILLTKIYENLESQQTYTDLKKK